MIVKARIEITAESGTVISVFDFSGENSANRYLDDLYEIREITFTDSRTKKKETLHLSEFYTGGTCAFLKMIVSDSMGNDYVRRQFYLQL